MEAGFPCKDDDWIKKSDCFRQQFEELLIDVIKISNGKINAHILESGELVTEFTIPAERHTEHLTGIPINTDISKAEANLCAGMSREKHRELMQKVHCINKKAIRLLNEFIEFKESILREMESCRLFSFNYPLLIQHIS